MKKAIFSTLFLMMLISSQVIAEEYVYKSDEEFFRAMTEMDKEIEEIKAENTIKKVELVTKETKLKNLIKLEKTVDELAKKLGTDD